MKIHDISLPISESGFTAPGYQGVEFSQPRHMDKGDRSTVSFISMYAHQGTHVDAPAHFIPGGSGVDSLDLNVLVGPALVVEIKEADVISADLLKKLKIPSGIKRILFHTRNSELWEREEQEFREDFVGLSADGADWVISHGIQLVGVDYVSVAAWDDIVPVHKTLLRAGVIAVESLNLTGIAGGEYQLVCLPLNLVGLDGAPARAILIEG